LHLFLSILELLEHFFFFSLRVKFISTSLQTDRIKHLSSEEKKKEKVKKKIGFWGPIPRRMDYIGERKTEVYDRWWWRRDKGHCIKVGIDGRIYIPCFGPASRNARKGMVGWDLSLFFFFFCLVSFLKASEWSSSLQVHGRTMRILS